jgi:hypothetical protein
MKDKKYGKGLGKNDSKYVKKHNDMYKPKGMNLKDGKVDAATFKCKGDKTMYPKSDY